MSPDHPTARSAQANYPTTYPKAFWVALVIGWTMIGFGVRGLLINADSPMPTEPVHWATLFVKAGILNDLLVLPIVFVFGRLIARVVSPRVRAPVQGGLICAAIVTAFAYPERAWVRVEFRQPDDPAPQLRNWPGHRARLDLGGHRSDHAGGVAEVRSTVGRMTGQPRRSSRSSIRRRRRRQTRPTASSTTTVMKALPRMSAESGIEASNHSRCSVALSLFWTTSASSRPPATSSAITPAIIPSPLRSAGV